MKTLINFSSSGYRISQKTNAITGICLGGFDNVISYTEKDIDTDFYNKNVEILNSKKGAGFWLWKPYFILNTLNKLKDDDFLFYCDSACFFIRKVDFLIDYLLASKQDIMVFELPLLEYQWTKPSIKSSLKDFEISFYDTNQRLASFILIKKTNNSTNFVKEWLNLCKNPYLLTDINELEDRNLNSSFIAHRHDQSLFSLLSKKHQYVTFRDPSQFGDDSRLFNAENRIINPKVFDNSNYPRILIQYRRTPVWKAIIKSIINYY